MSNQEYVTFKSYYNKAILEEATEILAKEKIEFVIDDCSIAFDPSYANNEIAKDYRLKIKADDFLRTTKIFENAAEIKLEQVPDDYYLMNFNDDELYEIIRKPDEWGSFDLMLAKKLLKKKGKEVSELQENNLKAERINELAIPEKTSNFWIIIGYLSSLFGGLLGIIIGLTMLQSKKLLPNGKKVNSYTETQRMHGVMIAVIGLVTLTIFIISLISDSFRKIIYERF